MNQQALRLQLIACLLITGCSVDLAHGPLASPERMQSGTAATYWRASGPDFKQVGTAVIGLLLWLSIEIDGDGNERVADQVRDALRRAGYGVTIVNRQAQLEGPVLDCRVNRLWFWGTYFLWPFAQTWGSIELVATVVAPDHTARWSRRFRGGAFTFNFWDPFNAAASEAMTEIANDMVQEFSGEDFRRAITGQ